jgi:hypothetical protein
MATQAQIDANRLNALKSTGPATPEGRQAVRFNALKTGIDATQVIIPGESSEEFEQFAAALRHTWDPADLAESAFVDRLIHNSWRLDRLRIAEAQIWDCAINSGAADFGEAFERTEKILGRLQIQVASIERALSQATRDLERLQAAREAHATAQANQPPRTAPAPAPITEQSQLFAKYEAEIEAWKALRTSAVDDSPFDF